MKGMPRLYCVGRRRCINICSGVDWPCVVRRLGVVERGATRNRPHLPSHCCLTHRAAVIHTPCCRCCRDRHLAVKSFADQPVGSSHACWHARVALHSVCRIFADAICLFASGCWLCRCIGLLHLSLSKAEPDWIGLHRRVAARFSAQGPQTGAADEGSSGAIRRNRNGGARRAKTWIASDR